MTASTRVHACIDDGLAFPLTPDDRAPALWSAVSDDPLADGPHRLTVRAEDGAADGGTGHAAAETITFLVNRDGAYEDPVRGADGSDRNSVGAWPEKHLLGTQLDPNRNGREW